VTSQELVVRVVAMPSETNPDGDVFGGWLVSQMDLAEWVHARKKTRHRLVTVAIDNIVFHKPVYVGDCILCYAATERMRRTSITVKVDVMVERRDSYEEEQVTEGRDSSMLPLVRIGSRCRLRRSRDDRR
jgi:acyl-CoA thioesterase YciA